MPVRTSQAWLWRFDSAFVSRSFADANFKYADVAQERLAPRGGVRPAVYETAAIGPILREERQIEQ